MAFDSLIPKAIEIKGPQIRERPITCIKDKGNSLSTITAGIVRVVRKLPSSPNTSGRATLTKKAHAAVVKQSHLTKGGGNFRVTFGRFGRLSSFA
ncbi:hypothetical protein AVEN_39338-1 [Araneus ventricosus]|uniref:Uncharacterized protein n=1 Tax=Araneus ventricosus TaxID=182803 RepID=A0A4Y2PVX5_ARAVE|nr:hypothetical protein AVEN_39338-1 [Araneus ventricosus]